MKAINHSARLSAILLDSRNQSPHIVISNHPRRSLSSGNRPASARRRRAQPQYNPYAFHGNQSARRQQPTQSKNGLPSALFCGIKRSSPLSTTPAQLRGATYRTDAPDKSNAKPRPPNDGGATLCPRDGCSSRSGYLQLRLKGGALDRNQH
jgi:hypothetical protein